MGRHGSGMRSYLARLERGKIADPRISTITLFLRACGAQFFEFYDTLTRIEPVVVDTRRLERAPMKKEQKRMLLHRVKREAYNYQEETSHPKRGKPMPLEKQKPAASKLADYRVQVAVIEHEVKKLLGSENVTFVEIAGYLTIARRILGELRRGGRPGTTKQGSIADYVTRNRLNPELVTRIRELVNRCLRR
jgi:transcriptional regulator with XRE-family HTH domain